MTQTLQGRKFDEDKLRYDLIPVLAQEEVVKVITLGAKKYDPENWKNVPEGRRRYYAAAMRHMEAWRKGEKQDEIGTHHIANAISNLMFILEKELQGIEDIRENSAKEVDKSVDNTLPLGLWLPDDSGEWIETSACDFEYTKEQLSGRYIEVLADFERDRQAYKPIIQSFEFWFCGFVDWGNRVAFKLVK